MREIEGGENSSPLIKYIDVYKIKSTSNISDYE